MPNDIAIKPAGRFDDVMNAKSFHFQKRKDHQEFISLLQCKHIRSLPQESKRKKKESKTQK